MKTVAPRVLRVFPLAVACILAASAAADPCADYPLLEDTRLGGAPATHVNETFTRDGDIVYVGNWRFNASGFEVYDIADPTTPIHLATVEGYFPVADVPPRVMVSGDLGYVSGCVYEIPVYDLTNPREPHRWTQIPMPLEVICIAVHGDVLYAASWGPTDPYGPTYNAIHVLDVSDPVHAVVLGEYWEESSIWPFALEVRDGLAFVGVDEGLQILDVSDPTAIAELARLDLGYAVGFIRFDGDLLHVMVGRTLHVIDIADPADPVVVSSTSTEARTATGFDLHDGLAVSAHGGHGLRLIDVSDPTQPSPVSVLPALGYCYGVSLEADCFLVMQDDELLVAAPQFPDHVDHLGQIDLHFFSQRLHQADGILYTLHGYYLEIHDVTDPAAPVHLGSYHDGTGYYALSVDGDVLYLANQGDAGAIALDVSDPTQPQKLSSLPGERISGIHAKGGKVALGLRDGGVQLVDATDPAAPVLLGSITLDPGHRTYGVALAGDHIYAAGSTTYVVDAGDPAHMQVVASAATGFTHDLVADGQWIYTGDEDWLRILRFMPPETLEQVRVLPQVGTIEDMHLAGDLLYVASRASGVHVFDVSAPTETWRMGAIPPLREAYGVTGAEDVVTILNRTAYTSPQTVVRFHPIPCGLTAAPDPHLPPAAELRLAAAPNPFNPLVSFSFDTPRAGTAELAVYDLRGRRVATVFHGRLDAGPQRFRWNGRDDGGRPAASGVYVARLVMNGAAVSRSVTLSR